MKTLIKTLAVLTAGVGAVAVVKRVRRQNKNIHSMNSMHFSNDIPDHIKPGDLWYPFKGDKGFAFKAI